MLKDREYADLCVLPELTEQTLLDNLRDRFNNGIEDFFFNDNLTQAKFTLISGQYWWQ